MAEEKQETTFKEAWAEATANITGAKKNAKNPHYKSDYADLGAVMDACKGPLHDAGLILTQAIERTDDGWVCKTVIEHKAADGEKSTVVPLLNGKGDMQGLGSAITYARRYGIMSLLGICPEDDDGNAASQAPKAARAQQPPKDEESLCANIEQSISGIETLKELQNYWLHMGHTLKRWKQDRPDLYERATNAKESRKVELEREPENVTMAG